MTNEDPKSPQDLADDPLGDAEYRSLGDFRRAVREFLAFSEHGAEDHGISSQQHQALLAIRAHTGPEAMSIRELADCLMIKHHSAVGLVDRMVERDLVVRIPSELDARKVLLELRPKGRDILKTISLRNLGQLKQTGRILADVLRTVRRLDQQGSPMSDEDPSAPSSRNKGPRAGA